MLGAECSAEDFFYPSALWLFNDLLHAVSFSNLLRDSVGTNCTEKIILYPYSETVSLIPACLVGPLLKISI